MWIFLALEMAWNAPQAANGVYLKFGTPEYESGVVEAVRRFENHLLSRYGITKDRIFRIPTVQTGTDPKNPLFCNKSVLLLAFCD